MFKDKSERDSFIEANLGLVHSLAGRFKARGIEYEELFAAGSLGLIKATDNFEPERGLCFSTYAVPVILGEIKKLFRDGGTVKVSRSLKELSIKINVQRNNIVAKNGHEPSISELSEIMGVSQEQIADAICSSAPPFSLSLIYDDEQSGKEIDVPVQGNEIQIEDRIALKEALSKIPPYERKLIILRYFSEKTQSETAKILKTTQVQISRLERKILENLRNEFN